VRFLAIVVCLALAWRYASHAPLRRYFAANLICSVICELVLLRWPYNSAVYAVAWCVGVAVIFVLELDLMWYSIHRVPVRKLVLLPALGISTMLGFQTHPSSLFQWIQTLNGASDCFCGFAAGIGAAHLDGPSRKIALSLSLLWLSQSLYEFGFGLHLRSPAWVTLNNWMPTFLVAAGSLWLAYLGRYTQSVR
jgi:hypothetical protein